MKIRETVSETWTAVKSLAVLTALLGLIYPLAVTLASRLCFPRQASGSLIIENSRIEGSSLIGQSFKDPKYFWSRPSATSPYPYNPASSGASNLGPNNPALLDAVRQRVADARAANPKQIGAVPADLVTASASGVDPDISPEAALYQAARVARRRNLSIGQVDALIQAHIEGSFFNIWGRPRVNVLELNLALDALAKRVP